MKPLPKDNPGYRLRLLRLKLKKAQQEFADELGVSGSTMSRYEKNLRCPNTYFFRLLREKTGVDLNWLLTGKGSMFEVYPQDLIRIKSIGTKIQKQAEKMEELIRELK